MRASRTSLAREAGAYLAASRDRVPQADLVAEGSTIPECRRAAAECRFPGAGGEESSAVRDSKV